MTMTKIVIGLFLSLCILISGADAQGGPTGEEYVHLAENSNKNLERDKAIAYYEKAAVEFETGRSIERFVDSYNQIGIILTRQDKYESARKYLDKALSVGLSSLGPNDLTVATTYLSLGVVFSAEDKFDQSLAITTKH